VVATVLSGPAPAADAAAPHEHTSSARALIEARAPVLHASAHEAFLAQDVISVDGLHYAPYERTYRGLPVVGGDFVVVTDDAGRVVATSVAHRSEVRLSSTSAQVSRARAARLARQQVGRVTSTARPALVVWQGARSHLAWEVRVNGRDHGQPVSETVYVDAGSGAHLATERGVRAGTGHTAHAGTVPIPTTTSGSTYSMSHPQQTHLACQNYSSGKVFAGSDDDWGNGSRTDLETACADAMYVVEQERQMLTRWLGRNGMDGKGGWVPIKMGLDEVDAFYTDGESVTIGHQRSGTWMSWTDVVAHEFGHGIDDHTPGGLSDDTTAEFVADTFGAATEWFANNALDKPDYVVGEEGDKVIRNMYDPAALGDPGCFDRAKITSTETHDAAGVGNHWFYLLAEGSHPTNGQPVSPTCNSAKVTGAGIRSAIKVLYHAMLMKTSTTSYPKYRLWTVTAAKNLDPTCALFSQVKAAWDAVSVPAKSGEPTCGAGGGVPAPCTGQLLGNPGFESGVARPWLATRDVIDDSDDQPSHSGDWKAWLGGYGEKRTTQLSQRVTIPTGCRATLSYYLHIGSDETTERTAYDKLVVKVGNKTLTRFSNLDERRGYHRHTVDLSAFAGQTVTLAFTVTESPRHATSFLIDDATVTLG
jgi:Zn-dependent metalloprotease